MAASAGARTLLVVDDDPGIRDMLAVLLEIEGFRVLTATDGREALETLRSERPDVVLLDVMMPVMNGWELVEAMRSDPALRTVPIVMLTAFGDVVAPRGVPLLRKPVELQHLLEAVSAAAESAP